MFLGKSPTTAAKLHIRKVSWDRGRPAAVAPEEPLVIALVIALPVDVLETGINLNATISGSTPAQMPISFHRHFPNRIVDMS
jgi:hypothetical protein